MTEFVEIYAEYARTVLEPAKRALDDVFATWKQDNYWQAYAEEGTAVPTPLQRLRSRIKRPEATLDKYQRLQERFPEGPTSENLPRMTDMLGARVVVYFPQHLRLVDAELRMGRHFELSEAYPPKSYLPQETLDRIGLDKSKFKLGGPKPSGYASLHYVVRLIATENSGQANPWFELQTRTMLEEVWGEVEHQLGYKQASRAELTVSRSFRVISTHLSAIDDHFDYMYDTLVFRQSTSQAEGDDEITAANLPRVLERIECLCDQDEVAQLLSILRARQVNTVREFNERARPHILDAIRSELLTSQGIARAGAFHIVSTVVQMQPNSSADDARRALRGNMAMVAATLESRDRSNSPPVPEKGFPVPQPD